MFNIQFLHSNSLIFTGTAAECEAQSLLSAVEHHVEAFHNSGADHQAVS